MPAQRFYITTPIYYVNDVPHVGHYYTTLVADTVARYRRLVGESVYFLTGTDEHGQKIERAAEEQGVTPLQLADRVVDVYLRTWEQLGISHDDFIRTSETRHRSGVEALIGRIEQAGDLYLDRHEGWYCTGCETFYTDKELSQPDNRCPVHDTEAEWKSEENVFFRLSKYQKPLLDWLDNNPEAVQPATRRNEVRSFIESGLRDLSVSRTSVDWGIPFPGYPGHTVYVWLDALSNYITALGMGTEGDDLYQEFWQAEGAQQVQLVGKDILRFHAVYWPALLLSAGLPLPTTVWAHGWWLRDTRKMSKSIGNIARPAPLVKTFGSDALRYFLLREMVFGQDANFSDEAFVDRFNSDLANDLGNTLSRLVTLSRKLFDGKTPPHSCDNNPLMAIAAESVAGYRAAMDEFAFQTALRELWKLLSAANQYLVEREPWKLIKEEGASERVSRVVWNAMESLRIVASALVPILPETAPQILTSLGITEPVTGFDALSWGGLPTGREIVKVDGLFPRIDKEQYLAADNLESEIARDDGDDGMISIEDFGKVQLRVGTVTAAEAIPKANKLLKLTVDLGEDHPRTVVAGVAKVYQPEELLGWKITVVANLKPAKLMGVESQGMVLAAVDADGSPRVLRVEEGVPNGSVVR